MSLLSKQLTMPTAETALPGRSTPIRAPAKHFVLGTSIGPPYPEACELALFGMGCFWGAERKFWQAEGVFTTAVGYSGGFTPNPTYQEVCTGLTGHNEVVRVVFDPGLTSYDEMLKIFWENHDPTQGMRQGNDAGTQYRSGIYTHSDVQAAAATASCIAFETALRAAGYGEITTEIVPAADFYFAEEYHQQYLAKNPAGYCGLGGTGVACALGTGASL